MKPRPAWMCRELSFVLSTTIYPPLRLKDRLKLLACAAIPGCLKQTRRRMSGPAAFRQRRGARLLRSVQTASDAPGDDLAAATSPARPRRRRADRNLPSPADEAPQRREEPDPQPNSSERPQPDGRPAVEGTAPLPKPATPAAEALPPMPAFIPHPFEDIQPFDTPNGVPFFSEPDAPDNPAFFTWPDTAAYQQLPSHLQDYAEPIEDEAAAQPADYSGEPYLTDEIAAFFSDASDGQANGAPFARVEQDSGALYWNEPAATSAQHYPQSVPPHPATSARAGYGSVPASLPPREAAGTAPGGSPHWSRRWVCCCFAASSAARSS